MENEESRGSGRPLVGIYTPELEGFYFGELVGQILSLCRIKNYRAVVIKTGGYGQFNSTINSDAMNMVIVLRNAIHYELARELLASGKSMVSIAYDYFPLEIPLVTSNSEEGIELAFSYLSAQEHKRFLFIGNLKNFDVRKRYEAYCEQLEQLGLGVSDENLIQVDDDLLSGGYQAAGIYLNRKHKAKAIICGTAMNSIGFAIKMEKRAPELKKVMSVVAFDAISLIPILDPNITTVDQNLNLLAHKALSIVSSKETDFGKDHHYKVSPKLISNKSDFMKLDDAYLATSFELGELYNANYMKSVLCSISEWSQSIAASKLDNVMILRPLFKNLICKVSSSRAVMGKSGKQYLVYTKLVGIEDVVNVDVNDANSVNPTHAFPSPYNDFNQEEYDTSLHIPRFKNGNIWGFISAYGKVEDIKQPSSYTGFSAFLNHIVDLMHQDLTSDNAGSSRNEKNLQGETESKIFEGEIVWNKLTNEAIWDEAVLKILGFSSVLEQQIYRHMNLYDRLDTEDSSALRDYLTAELIAEMPIQVKFRHKSKELLACDLRAGGADEHANVVLKVSVLASEV